MPPGFEPFPAGLLLGALLLIFVAQLAGAWLTRDRSAWSLLVLTGSAGILHPAFVDACMPLVMAETTGPPDPRLHGWLAMLAGHATLYLGGLQPDAEDTPMDRVRRLRLPIVMAFGIVLLLASPWIESRPLGSLVLAFHAGLVFAVTYATAMQRRFAEGMRPASYLIAAMLVLAVGTPLIVWIGRLSHLAFDIGVLAAGVLILHLLLLGAATLAEPYERLRHRLRLLEAEQDAAAAARERSAALEEENRQVEDRFLARAAEIAALSQELESTRLLLDSHRRHLTAVTEDAPDALIWIDGKSLQVIGANAKSEELFGISRDELRGLPLARLFPSADSPQTVRRLLEAPSGDTLGSPISLTRKGGRPTSVEVTPLLVHFRDQHVVYFVLRDRTSLDQQVADIQRARAQLDAFHDLPDLVAAAHLPADGLAVWSPTAATVARLPRDEAVKLGAEAALDRLAGPAAASALARMTASAMAGRRPFPEYHRLADERSWHVAASRVRDPRGDGWLLVATPTG